MLRNLIELGSDLKSKFDKFNDWKEISFNEEDKEQLGKLDNVTQVLNHSIKFKSKDNHIIIPSQYILYALAAKEFAMGLKAHLDVFDQYKNGKSANQVGDEVTKKSYNPAGLNLDEFSETIFLEAIVNEEYNFKPKSIINGNEGSYTVRGTADFFSSVILKIIDVPDASSAMLGKLIFYLTKNPDIYKYLESRFIEHIPYLVEDSVTKSFAKKVFLYLNHFDNLNNIQEFITKNPDPSFSSIKKDDTSLTSIFKTSTSLLSEEDLKQGGRVRYFKDPLFILNNEFYYFSTEWTNGTDSRLDLESLEFILTQTYPKFFISKQEENYYLKESSQKGSHLELTQIDFSISNVLDDIFKSGLIYKESIITRFISSLVTKPFILLTGLSGSGKTKLAQTFVQWITQDKSQYKIVPVGADWTNREPLLGYVNALESNKYVLPENGVLNIIIDANKEENRNRPFFIILDEMNLSHVERYFADFLSVMESNEKFNLHNSNDPLDGGDGIKIEKEYLWPHNLFVIGTVNIDETTYMFSPKVLDRANVIEFRVNQEDMGKFLTRTLEAEKINGRGANMGKDFLRIAKSDSKSSSDDLIKTLNSFFVKLQPLGAEFGYRTASEIQSLFAKIDLINSDYADEKREDDKIDIAIMQKLLPKLHGSRRKLLETLNILAQNCLQETQEKLFNERGNYNVTESNSIRYKMSFEKIARMYKNAIENGFASYAEA